MYNHIMTQAPAPTAYDLHMAAKPNGRYEPAKVTWYTSTRLTFSTRNQSLIGEQSFLVDEVRGGDHTPAVPWRAKVIRNAYDDQSSAVIERWSGSHLGGGTAGQWVLVTTVPIDTLPVCGYSYVDAKTIAWHAAMCDSCGLALEAGLTTLGLL